MAHTVRTCTPHLFIALLFLSFGLVTNAGAQRYMYVNTNNLIMRDRPSDHYNVTVIMDAGFKLTIDSVDKDYKHNKAVTSKYYCVSFRCIDHEGFNHYYGGWVEKRYMVPALSKVTVKGADTTDPQYISPPYQEHEWLDDPKVFNDYLYPPPKYKGGVAKAARPKSGKKEYHIGPHGGCYYINGNGNKEYVDSKFCNGLKN